MGSQRKVGGVGEKTVDGEALMVVQSAGLGRGESLGPACRRKAPAGRRGRHCVYHQHTDQGPRKEWIWLQVEQ